MSTSRRRGADRLAVSVLVLGLGITAALSFVAATVNSRNEDRLLNLQTREAATALTVALPTIETPLSSAVQIAEATNGDSAKFQAFMTSYVGLGLPFSSASLWQLVGGTPSLVAVVGTPIDPAQRRAQVGNAFSNPTGTGHLQVSGLLQGGSRLAYAYEAGSPQRYLAYAQTQLTPNHRIQVPKGFAFADLDFALYLGRTASPSMLLEATVPNPPLRGSTASATIPFANSHLTLVAASLRPLGGALSRDLTLIVVVLGVVLSIGAALLTGRLVHRRKNAEELAEENKRLYAEQATVTSTFQRALLPSELPSIGGFEIAARYEAGHGSTDIGGDWYDAIPLGGNKLLFVVGDVSGRGLQAAVVMATLHYAIRAFATEEEDPGILLDKLSRLLNIQRDGRFATVLAGTIDADRSEMILASAGHFPPLLVTDGHGAYTDMKVGPPIGSGMGGSYETIAVSVASQGSLVVFTDGLIERRGETLDVGLERVRTIAAAHSSSLEELLSEILSGMAVTGSDDDTALLGISWNA